MKEYLSRREWELAGVYEDEMSGATSGRPGLDRLMEDARLHLSFSTLTYNWLVHCVMASSQVYFWRVMESGSHSGVTM